MENDCRRGFTRFVTFWWRGNQQLPLAPPRGRTTACGDTARNQQLPHASCPLQRQLVVEFRGREGIGVTDDGDFRCRALGQLRENSLDLSLRRRSQFVFTLQEIEQEAGRLC